jgi:beta-glucanase (GH16 family)
MVQAQTWNLVWSDEFDGKKVNSSNWVFETGGGGWGNAELENYTIGSNNAVVENGNLEIIAKKETLGSNSYTSARIKTYGLHYWTYGKIEARIKIPVGQGIWPAFWILGEDINDAGVGWPKCGEVDIMEHIDKESLNHGTMHWDNNGHAQYGGQIACDESQFHNYALVWDQNNLTWLLDDKQYFQGSIANNINSTEEFHKPFFIILNLAVGGTWPGNPDNTTSFPDTMFVDYVRVSTASTGIQTNMEKRYVFTVYPNPANDKLFVESDSLFGEKKFEIINLFGQVIYSNKIFKLKTVDISHLTKGTYLVKLMEGNKVEIKKFVKL